MDIPSELKYTEEHEWLSVEDDIATIGITDYAQGELGDIVYLEIAEVGTIFGQMEVFGTIEAVKTVAELFSPVSGEILEVNSKLEDEPEIINDDPYTEGWMIKIKMGNPSELDDLLSPEEYKSLIS
jgi:glycine cleavage system H protein